MNYNQEAFRQLAIAHVPIKVLRTGNDGVIQPQSFVLVVDGAEGAEMRPVDGHNNGCVFFQQQCFGRPDSAVAGGNRKTGSNDQH